MKRCAVTGADGFVGRHLCGMLVDLGYEVRPLVRDRICEEAYRGLRIPSGDPVVVGDVDSETEWSAALSDIDTIFHLAARVHVMRETQADPLESFRRVNTAGTARLAEEAARAGAGRLVYVSTAKVNGEGTDGRSPFRETDPAAPEDPYSVSKAEAESALARIAAATTLETVIVRPPLVHGPGVGGNLLRLMKLVERGWPLPFGAAENRRSLIGVGNLCDVLIRCATHTGAAGATYLVSDGADLSLKELVGSLIASLRSPTRLFPVPAGWMRAAADLLGRRAVVDRLFGSLELDISRVRADLDWKPPVPVESGLAEMCARHARGDAPPRT